MKRRLIALLLAGLAFIGAAIYLRAARGSGLREWATSLLGYERRAIAEHFLAGFGVPVAAAMAFVLLWWFLEWTGPLIVRLFLLLGRSHQECAAPRTPAQVIGGRVPLILAAALAFAYAVSSYLFEKSQELTSVYGHPGRGYFQSGQFVADLLGAFIGVLSILVVLRQGKK